MPSRFSIRRAILFLAAALILPLSAPASDLFVSHDDPFCDGQQPCYGSIQAAIDQERLVIEGKNAHEEAGPADRIVIGRAEGAAP